MESMRGETHPEVGHGDQNQVAGFSQAPSLLSPPPFEVGNSPCLILLSLGEMVLFEVASSSEVGVERAQELSKLLISVK